MKRKDMYFTDQQVEKLNLIETETGIKFSELVRRAVDEYLDGRKTNNFSQGSERTES